jgi:hypothetical protein
MTLANATVSSGNATVTTLTAPTHNSASSLTFQTNGTTTAITVDTSQNVGIGTTSPSSRLHTYTASGGNKLTVEANAASQQAVVSLVTNATTPGQCQLYMGKSGATTNGQVGYDPNSDYMYFYSNNTERMRIDSSGNLLVGLTSAISGFSKTIQIQDSSSSALCTSITGANARNWFTGCNSSGLYGVYDSTAGAYRLQIGTTGRVYIQNAYTETTGNSANLFVDTDGRLIRSTSSLKYKQNVQDATHGLTDLLKLRSVTYQGKSESDDDKTFGGLIAEEVHDAGLTEFVQYAEDGSPDALAYGNMVSLCVKSIQELKAINDQQAETINALTARIVALEAK